MIELLTAAQMRILEQAAIESGAVTGCELMERAGHGVVAAVFSQWPDLAQASQKAVVLCGPGNNGGDGFVVARLLRDWGWRVEVLFDGDPVRLSRDARANYDRWVVTSGSVLTDSLPAAALNADLCVDALFGVGLSRPLQGKALEWVRACGNALAARTVAVDLPSGLCGDSGRVLGATAVRAALTVSFHAAKRGSYLGRGPEHCGKVVVADIGLSAAPGTGDVRLLQGNQAAGLGKDERAHKYSNGHALILTGGAGKTGAARLAARGALRIGAGVVTLGVPPLAQSEVASQITALMLAPVEDGMALAEVLRDGRITALCLGPGLGLERARDLVPVALGAGRAVVLDADALTAFADGPEQLFAKLHSGCILTPHGGEFERIFPDIARTLTAPSKEGPAYSKVDATRAAARRAGCVVLFKGPDTVIADPQGRCGISSAHYERAAPWLATAGSGDVLAGFITGLLARGIEPLRAGQLAAGLHVECARHFGPGLIAEDLPEELPKVLRMLDL